MFHFDVTIEDLRIIATEAEDSTKHLDIEVPMSVRFCHAATGESHTHIMSLDAVIRVLSYGMSGLDGPNFIVPYDQVCADVADIPAAFRPIP
jgi:hypothetical protein